MSFDMVTGQLWAGDVGQSAWEEIDLIARGANYGWRLFEGNHEYDNPQGLPPADFRAPVHEYSHSAGCSVIGGHVYRGSAVAPLQGQYVYTDYCSGTLWALGEGAGGVQQNVVVGDVPGNPSGFGEDQDGELYITSLNGRIYRIAPGDGAVDSGFATLLSQTGLFADTATLEVAPGLVEYGVRVQFWSDGVRKRRWFWLPPGEQIDFSAQDAWGLPPGSVTVKHFEARLSDGSLRRLETRVLVHQETGWRGTSYRWNNEQTDAALVTNVEWEQLQLKGSPAPQAYEYPSQASCLRCHTAAAGQVLGLRTTQLNRGYGTPRRNQLSSLRQAGLFSAAVGSPAQYDKLSLSRNESLPVADRARAYLDANCSQCHRPGGPTGVNMDLRWNTARGKMHVLWVEPSGGDLGIAGARRVRPGSPGKSVLWQRMRRLDQDRMPPLGSHAVDTKGVALIRQWIVEGAQ